LIIGREGFIFDSYAPITRQEAAVVTYNYLEKAGFVFDVPIDISTDKNLLSLTVDCATWAGGAILSLACEEIITGYPGKDGIPYFDPLKNITRAEAAAIINRALKKMPKPTAAPTATPISTPMPTNADGSTQPPQPTATPIPSSVLTDVKAITVDNSRTIVLKNDGTVWAWGRNDYGQIGDGTTTHRSTPTQINITNVKEIVVGRSTDYIKSDFTLALKNDGTVWAWGWNGNGELGDGTTTNRSIPTQVNINDVKGIATGTNNVFALKNDGTVWAWGWNGNGQLGDGTTTLRLIPTQIDITNVKEIVCGIRHTVALKNDGTVWAWGSNQYGQLGDETTTNRLAPTEINITNVKKIVAGYFYTMALKNDGTLWAWGQGKDGQLGNGTLSNKSMPTEVDITNVKDIVTGGYYSGGNAPIDGNHSFAIKNDGTVWAWGNNHYGQLGDGTTTNRFTPVQVNITNVKEISVGAWSIIALKNDGTVWAWGQNAGGLLGDGTTTDRHTPVQTIGLNEVKSVEAGQRHMVALKNNGTVWAWGHNYYGQLGDGTTISRNTPTQI